MPAIATVSVFVDDMTRAVNFYAGALGFEVEAKPNDYVTVLKHEGVALVLCQAEVAHRLEYPTESGTVVGLATKNVDSEAKRLKAGGVDFVIDTPTDMPGGKYIAVRDPAGNVVEVIQFDQ